MLAGEPSPSLAKINVMNIVKLEAKIAHLVAEQNLIVDRLKRLQAHEPHPIEQIGRLEEQQNRLKVLEHAARERLEEKVRRKAAWEEKHR